MSEELQEGLVFDLSGVEEQKGFELLPKGTYNAIVDEQNFKESSAGNPMIETIYQLDGGEYDGRKFYDYWVLKGNGSEFGLAKVKKFLTRVCPETDISSFNPETFCDNGVAIGNECTITLNIQTQKKGDYKGEKRNTVSDVTAREAGSFM